ncbi:MAG: hypothetical protein JKY54_18095 [Flavobacteriales bacterium]|nr:hypothetical protein [Flavobacteriales bacterium]
MSESIKIVFLAPNIPQLYVALEFIGTLQRKKAQYRFVIYTKTTYYDQINLPEVEVISSLIGADSKSMAPAFTHIVFVGHSYFINEEMLLWAQSYNCPTFWINAHLERDVELKVVPNNAWFNFLYKTVQVIFYGDFADFGKLVNSGFESDRLHRVGNAKYDCALPSIEQIENAEVVLDALASKERQVIVGVSMLNGPETDCLLASYQTLRVEIPDLLLVLAPRLMEEVASIKMKLEAYQFTYGVSTKPSSWNSNVDVLIIDQVGLLKGFYHSANVVFIGRTFFKNPGGGSNFIEPAAQGAPILIGTYLSGFINVLHDFKKEDALVQISHPEELISAFRMLLQNPIKAKAYGERAAKVVQNNCGGLSLTADLLSE